MGLFADRIHRLPREWSNRELAKFALLFHGDVVNVSGWKDIDKEGRFYREYFANASSYAITNYKSDFRGHQGGDDELFLDLEDVIPSQLEHKFDVVFNHTTLEHIYDAKTAFSNLCHLSKNVVITVVPFLQQYHADYGDYWRFTPLVMKKMYEEQGFDLLYQSFNSHRMSSVYVFSIGSRNPEVWTDHFDWSYSAIDPFGKGEEPYIGCHAIPNLAHRIKLLLRRGASIPKKRIT